MSQSTFADFWSLYPRRIAKRTAQKSWDREMRAGTDPDDIMAGLRRQLSHLNSREPQFIPHPSTWLNQGRWEDEVQTERPRSSGNGLIDALGRAH